MLVTVKTFDGHDINDGSDYGAAALGINSPQNASPIFVQLANADSKYAGVYSMDVKTIPVNIYIRNYSNRYALIAQLKTWLRPRTSGYLVITFSDEAIDYQILCSVQSLVQDKTYPDHFTAILLAASSTWQTVEEETDDWEVTASGDKKVITVGGFDETKLSIDITATELPTVGYAFQNLYQLVNTPGINYGVRPWCVSVDTAALCSYAANHAHINLEGGITADQTTIPWDTQTGTLPSAGMAMIEDEQISYTAKTATELTGCTRGINGTEGATHADDVAIYQSKMQADCDDLRVVVGGSEVRRWISAPNTAATKVWFNLNIGPGYSLELLTNVSDSGPVTELAFKVHANNRVALAAMPSSGLVYHGTEWLEYSSKDLLKYKLMVRTRGALGTDQAAHVTGNVFKFIQTPVFLIYGNSAVGDPSDSDSAYDDDKPVFSLDESDNTEWVYDDTTDFYDPTKPSRPGSWTYTIIRQGDVSNIYHVKGDAASGDPALGMKAGSWYLAGTTLKSDRVYIYWQFCNPGGISEVSATGRKYYYSNWVTATLSRCALNATVWSVIWTEAGPTVQSEWQSVTQNDKASSDMANIRFGFVGTMRALVGAIAYFEILTCTVEFYSNNLPAVELLGEQSNILLDLHLRNNTSGDAINLYFPVRVNKTFTLDGENYLVSYNGGNALGALTPDDQSRDVWIRLNAGDNELEITSDYVGKLDIDLSWYARRL